MPKKIAKHSKSSRKSKQQSPLLLIQRFNSTLVYAFIGVFCVVGIYVFMAHSEAAAGTPEILSSLASNKCLDDYHSGKTSGSKVDLYACNGTEAQQFKLTDTSLKDYGLCLDVSAGAVINYSHVVLNSCTRATSQQWKVYKGGYLNVKSGKCLDDFHSTVANGTPEDIFTCNGTKAQLWTTSLYYPPVTATPVPPAPTPSTAPSATPTTTPAPTPVPGTVSNCAPNPHLCGFPDATNTGATGTLTNVPGTIKAPTASTGSGWSYDAAEQSIDITANGAVLENIVSTAAEIVVKANNVTIKNVSINVGDTNGFGIWLTGASNNGTSGVTIENSTISGANATSGRLLAGIKDIYGDSTGTKLLNNNIYFASTGLQLSEGTVENNYIHDMGYLSGDHLNGITSGAGTGTLFTIQHNTVFNSFSQTDAISLFEDFGVQDDVDINDNLVAGGGYSIYGGQNDGGAAISNIHITNNRFSTLYYANGGYWGPITAFTTDGTSNTFTGNVWDSSDAPITSF